MNENAEPPEIEELERTAAWRLRLVDEDAGDTESAAAARLLEALADDLRRNDHAALWTELRSIGNWLSESDAISDFADLAARYRSRIGISEHPADGAAYLAGLLAIARVLV
jgi:ferric-dicitrate binding protein FerR (iron transport regulator)